MVDESNNLEFISPWRCEGPCKAFMYNRNAEGYPSPGAPVGFTIDMGKGNTIRVCSTCKDLWLIAASNKHMRKEHVKWDLQNERAERLRPDRNYLD